VTTPLTTSHFFTSEDALIKALELKHFDLAAFDYLDGCILKARPNPGRARKKRKTSDFSGPRNGFYRDSENLTKSAAALPFTTR
jgi:hypothetical protein